MNRLLLLLWCLSSFGLDAQIALEFEVFASGFDKPLELVHAGDERLFVVEQAGRIHILWPDGTVAGEPFLDITDRVLDNANERGLLGLAFHPDFADNGWLFVNYTGSGGKTVISRFSLSADPNQADPDSEWVLLEIAQPYANHNGGCLRFGPDGYLYIGMGDGGAGGDPLDSGQDPHSLLGKMLRIAPADTGYGVPADNPFAGLSDTLPEIWALGLRNPWRFSFDRLTGDLWIADVGQNEWEEINFQPASEGGGRNYGWRCYEGLAPYNPSGCSASGAYTFPIHVYENAQAVGRSVTGGYVYRGANLPALYGAYIFGDYVSGRIWSLRYEPATGSKVVEELGQLAAHELSAFGEDLEGELYVCGLSSGRIYRLVAPCAGFSLSANVTAPCSAQAQGAIELSATGAHGAVNYQWSTGQVGSSLSALPPGTYSATATDEAGCVDTITIELEPRWAQPVITQNGASLSVADTFAAYQWLLDGQPIPDATTPTWMAQESGSYAVQVVMADSCVLWSEAVQVVLSTVEDPSLALRGLRLVPNPFAELVLLEGFAAHPIEAEVAVWTSDGAKVWHRPVRLAGAFSVALPLSHLPKGVLWVQVRAEKEQWVGKAVRR